MKTGELNLFHVLKMPYFIEVDDIAYVEETFYKLISLHDNSTFISRLTISSELIGLLSYYLRCIGENNITANTSTQLDKLGYILSIIDASLSDNITIQMLAKSAYMRPNSLTRLFKSHMGISPIHYIQNKRIDKAKHLIISTDIPICEVAAPVGLKDQLYFSKYFKKSVGFTPTAYRAMTKDTLYSSSPKPL